MLPHENPSRPWECVGTDLFHFDDSEWLLIVDYYSKFPVVRKLPNPCPSSTVVEITQQVFSEFGIPCRIISDNGPHFASARYRQFAKDWNITHVTSSPSYARSNGFAERYVQTVKHTFKKAKQSGQDPQLALLCLRATPIDSKLPSPAELLMQRKIQTPLLTKITNSHRDHEDIQSRLQDRQSAMKEHHDKYAQDLPPLYRGQSVRYQAQLNGPWIPAQVVQNSAEPRSYILSTPNGKTIRRNRVHIRETAEPCRRTVTFSDPVVQNTPSPMHKSPSVIVETKPQSSDHPQSLPTPDPTPQQRDVSKVKDHSNNGAFSQSGYKTKSGRVIKRPDKYK